MKQFKIVPYTYEEIVLILDMKERGFLLEKIARRVGRTRAAVSTLLSKWRAWNNGDDIGKVRLTSLFQEVVERRNNPLWSNQGEPVVPTPYNTALPDDIPEDPARSAEVLDAAIRTLQEAVVDYVVDEVGRQTTQKIAEKELEVLELKKKYETELIRMQTVLADAKNSSIVGLLRRKWGDQ